MSFPTDTESGIARNMTKLTQLFLRARYRSLVGDSNAANKVPLFIQGASGQTANLSEWYDSNKNLLAAIDPSGNYLGASHNLATVTITSAQLLALFTTAIQLVAAPGAGKVLIPTFAIIHYVFNTTAYTINGSTNLSVNWKDKTGVALTGTQATTGLIDQTADTSALLYPITATQTLDANAANQPLVLKLATANPTLGDGTLKVTLGYRTISF